MWTASLLLVILGTARISSSSALAYKTECPPKEDIYPCTCWTYLPGITIKCSGKNEEVNLDTLTTVIRSLSGKQTIETLMLVHLKLDTLPSNLFSDINIEYLRISDSQITSLSDSDRPFHGLENSLRQLKIEMSNIGGKIKLGHLKHLEILSLKNNDMPELDEDWFGDGIPSLEYLTIKGNDPRKIRSKAFASLNNLETIDIQYMNFEKFERSLFPNPAPKLHRLVLDNSGITDIPEDFLSNFPSLRLLELPHNRISRIEERTWKSNWNQLISLHLEGNRIICDSHLNWLLSKKKFPILYAKCEYPKELKGRKVGDLPVGKTKYDR